MKVPLPVLLITLFTSLCVVGQSQVTIGHIAIVDTPEIREHELDQIAHEVEGKACPATKLEDCIMERVRNAFQERGYFKAAVLEPRLKPSMTAGKADANVVVEPGLQYLLAEVQFRFSSQPALSKADLESLITAHPGTIFNIRDVRQTMENVRSYYQSRGYANAAVVVDTHVNDEKRELSLTLEVQP